jgi:hypothetical protein
LQPLQARQTKHLRKASVLDFYKRSAILERQDLEHASMPSHPATHPRPGDSMSELPVDSLTYNRARSVFVITALLLAVLPFKLYRAGLLNLELLLPLLFLLILWQSYRGALRTLPGQPAAANSVQRSLPGALFLFATMSAFGVLVGVCAGILLGRASGH